MLVPWNLCNNSCGLLGFSLVVGLKCDNRWKDFTPDLENDLFAKFLKEELIPYVDKNYPTKPFRVLLGHSIAGLRVVQTAIYNTDIFNSYIAIDPSVGNENNKWYNKARKDIEKLQFDKNRMFIAMGQTMPINEVQDTASIQKDTTSNSNHMRRIMEFSKTMSRKITPQNNCFQLKFYPQENHQSLTQIAIYDGFKNIFDWYKNESWDEIFEPKTKPERAVQLFKNYYARVSDKLGYKVVPPERSMLLDYLFNYKKENEKALAIAKYNLECHPNNSTAQYWVDTISKEMNEKK